MVLNPLRDSTVLDHGDPVGVVCGEEPVRDRDDRTALQHRGERAIAARGFDACIGFRTSTRQPTNVV
jgi:hypothetical protein